jgi:protein-S-isoprenylcysteine O-methyltransferase Ste14
MKQKHFIDSHKGATAAAAFAAIAVFDAWDNPASWLYLAMHGTYGLLWVLKSRTFPDAQWEQPCGIGYGAVIWGGLSLYWITPFLIAGSDVRPPYPWVALCVAAWGLGVFLHFASDLQKHTHLAARRGLLTDGLWARTRNPNYLGELLIYGGFGALAWDKAWVPAAVLMLFLVAVWIPNMQKKDRSLSRHEGFAAWKARTGLLFPRFGAS